MKNLLSISILAVLMLTVCTLQSFAQQIPNPRPSPTLISTLKVDDTYFRVVYAMPMKNDREIFGGLVPFDQVWRTGANEATEVTITNPIIFGDADVEAGNYTLFTIPGETEWTVILNRELGQWGAFRYNADHDVARISVPVEKLDEVWEGFRILITNYEGNITLRMRWDQTGVTVPITIK
jgi:hypothetical protein